MEYHTSDQLLRQSFRILIPKRKEKIRYSFILIMSVGISFIFAFLPNTVKHFVGAVGVFQTIVISIFAAETLVTGTNVVNLVST